MISEDDVRYVARLARLRLEPDEASRMTGELAKILAHIGKMSESLWNQPGHGMYTVGPWPVAFWRCRWATSVQGGARGVPWGSDCL